MLERARRRLLDPQRRARAHFRIAARTPQSRTARAMRPDRRQGRLRRRRLRRLHGADRRRAGLRLPDLRWAGRRTSRSRRSRASATTRRSSRSFARPSTPMAPRNAASARQASCYPRSRCCDERRGPSEETIQSALAGVLCRCTGYRAILDAVKEARLFGARDVAELPIEATRSDVAFPASTASASSRARKSSALTNGRPRR